MRDFLAMDLDDDTMACLFANHPAYEDGIWGGDETDYEEYFKHDDRYELPSFIKPGQLWTRKWVYEANYTKYDGTQRLWGDYIWELIDDKTTDSGNSEEE